MKQNKTITLLITIVLILALGLTSCSNNNESTTNKGLIESNPLENTSQNDLSDEEDTNTPAQEEDYIEPLEEGLSRASVEDQYKWDLETIYPSKDAFLLDVSEAELLIGKLESQKNTFTTTFGDFFTTFKTYEEVNQLINTLYVFATLQAHTDTSNTQYSELEDLANGLNTSMSEKTAYLMPSLVHMDPVTLDSYTSKAEMAPYRNFISSILKEKDHILSDGEEKILGQAQVLFDIPESIYEAYNYDTDLSSYLDEPNWEVFYTGSSKEKQEVLGDFYEKTEIGIDLIAEIYESEIKKNTFFAQARNYDSALESALSTDGVSREVYDTIFDVTHKNLDVLHRWIDLKKEIIGTDDKMYMADLYAPLIANPYVLISYEEGKNYILKALQPLGKQYVSDLNHGLNSRWVDVYPTDNKYEGGYQWGTYNTDPFVLLNYNNTMTDVSTLAHEMGHALNFKYSNASQSYFDASISIFNAEIASTTNESLVFEYRLKQAKTKLEKQQALLDYIALIEGTIFNQMIFADFEKQAYEAYEGDTPLNAEVFNQIMGDVYEMYYGPNFQVDDITSRQWADIPHFYNAFYVYKYATGLSAGLAFSDMILNGSQEDVDAYLTYLKSGSSKDSLTLLKEAGIDFSTGQPLQHAFDRFEALIDAFEETLK